MKTVNYRDDFFRAVGFNERKTSVKDEGMNLVRSRLSKTILTVGKKQSATSCVKPGQTMTAAAGKQRYTFHGNISNAAKKPKTKSKIKLSSKVEKSNIVLQRIERIGNFISRREPVTIK